MILVADGMSDQGPGHPVVLLCHWYVRVPIPVAAVMTIKAVGSPSLQVVWLVPIVPAVTLLMVIVMQFEVAVQDTPLKVDVTIRW